jgi:mRNA interferase RelE/StbE
LHLLTYLPFISTVHRNQQTYQVSLAEDAEDLTPFDERTAEPLISYDAMVKKLEKDLQRILAVIGALADNPRPAGGEKLTGQDRYRVRQRRYRVRQRRYRVLYSIQDEALTVWVVKVAHRRRGSIDKPFPNAALLWH